MRTPSFFPVLFLLTPLFLFHRLYVYAKKASLFRTGIFQFKRHFIPAYTGSKTSAAKAPAETGIKRIGGRTVVRRKYKSRFLFRFLRFSA